VQYWQASAHLRRLGTLLSSQRRDFRRALIGDYLRYFLPAEAAAVDDGRQRLDAAVQWLLRAQQATPDGGVSLGYFPCDGDGDGDGNGNGWRPSYPETTGYIIASLVEYAKAFSAPEALARAWEMARWEAEVQMPSGAVQGGMVCPPEQQVAAVFNTGMVLQGLTALIDLERDAEVIEAARRAAEFLVQDQGPDGHFRSHGKFVTAATIKTYNCLCAWALFRFGQQMDSSEYRDAAVRAVEAAIREQGANGWFANNCLTRTEAPLTHTIGYTLQGVLEVGVLAGREDFIDAAKRGLDPVLARVGRGGYLSGRLYQDWTPAAFSACVTGTAQLAIVAYRMFELSEVQDYRHVADRMVAFVKSTQRLDVEDGGMRGAVPGSYPLSGSYMTYGYPNWATKYFLDALLLQRRTAGAATSA
jgi:uncharacterized protein YyaL (SSP411 family)